MHIGQQVWTAEAGWQEAAERPPGLRARRPGLEVLYMSGYPEERLAADRVLDADVRLLHKPFTPSSLLARVQARLRE